MIEDAYADPGFASHPMVVGAPHVRFYAGAPLRLASGHALGTLCIVDTRPRTFDAADRSRLEELSALVMAQVDLHQMVGRIDSVTRLPNRVRLAEDLEGLCQQTPGRKRAMMLLDVMGWTTAAGGGARRGRAAAGRHPARDRHQAALADPARTTLYHVSETRFAFLAQEATRQEHDDAAALMVARMREPFTSGGISVELDIQCGLADFDLVPAEAADALRRATSAMHESISLAAATFGTATASTRRTGAPTRCCATSRVACSAASSGWCTSPSSTCEPDAIQAWRRSPGGSIRHWHVSPGEFVPLIESTTLIHEFTPWVIDTALAQLSSWRERAST